MHKRILFLIVNITFYNIVNSSPNLFFEENSDNNESIIPKIPMKKKMLMENDQDHEDFLDDIKTLSNLVKLKSNNYLTLKKILVLLPQ